MPGCEGLSGLTSVSLTTPSFEERLVWVLGWNVASSKLVNKAVQAVASHVDHGAAPRISLTGNDDGAVRM